MNLYSLKYVQIILAKRKRININIYNRLSNLSWIEETCNPEVISQDGCNKIIYERQPIFIYCSLLAYYHLFVNFICYVLI